MSVHGKRFHFKAGDSSFLPFNFSLSWPLKIISFNDFRVNKFSALLLKAVASKIMIVHQNILVLQSKGILSFGENMRPTLSCRQ